MSVDRLRRAILFAPLVMVLPRAANAVEPTYSSGGAAIRGFDTVAYFTLGEPTEGDPAITQEYKGAIWRFASAENRDLFAANPEQYAPQYGGYCAWAASRNYVAPSIPQAWEIVDGKLYLNFSTLTYAKWIIRKRNNIAKGDANWPGLLAG